MNKDIIGRTAGMVWRTISASTAGKMTMEQLQKELGVSMTDIAMAIGWLSREDKIFASEDKGVLYYSTFTNYYF